MPNNSTGVLPPATGGYHPLSDTTLPARVRGITFGTWVSSYYSHPAYSRSRSGSPADSTLDTSNNNASSLITKAQVGNTGCAKRTISDLEVRAPAYPFRKCTLDTLAPRDLLSCIDVAPGVRSESAFWALPRGLLLRQTERALAPGADESRQNGQKDLIDHEADRDQMTLADLKVRILYGLSSLWSVQWETWGLEDLTHEWRKEGKSIRPIEFMPVPNANHFVRLLVFSSHI